MGLSLYSYQTLSSTSYLRGFVETLEKLTAPAFTPVF